MRKPSKEKGCWNSKMGICSKVLFKTTKFPVKECLLSKTVLFTMDSGSQINPMAKVKKHGQMVLVTKGSIKMVKNTVKENTHGVIKLSMKENSKKGKFVGKAKSNWR